MTQDKLASRKAAAVPKGQVEVSFPQKGGKVVIAKQGEPIGNVCKKAGVRVKFDCKVRCLAASRCFATTCFLDF